MNARHRTTPTTSLTSARALLAAHPEITDAIDAIANGDECFGVCDAGRVRGAHLANHTAECAYMQMLLGMPVPADYTWDGKGFVYTPGTEEEDV